MQGHCERRRLSNVTQVDRPVSWSMVVPNDAQSSAVMFVAPGPPDPASTDVVYVAATRSTVGLPAYRDIVPAISARDRRYLELVSDDILTPSRVDVEVSTTTQRVCLTSVSAMPMDRSTLTHDKRKVLFVE